MHFAFFVIAEKKTEYSAKIHQTVPAPDSNRMKRFRCRSFGSFSCMKGGHLTDPAVLYSTLSYLLGTEYGIIISFSTYATCFNYR